MWILFIGPKGDGNSQILIGNRKMEHPLLSLFITLPLGCLLKICLVKILLKKLSGKKYS